MSEKKETIDFYSLEEVSSYAHDPLRTSVSIFSSLEEAKDALKKSAESILEDVKLDGRDVTYRLSENRDYAEIITGECDEEMDVYRLQIRMHSIVR